MDDVRKMMYGTLIGFVLVIASWLSFLFVVGCNGSLDCSKSVPTPERTSIPTLFPATLPAAQLVSSRGGAPGGAGAAGEVARPSNPGGAGAGILLPGDADVGSSIFAANCVICHAAQGKGGVLNPGSTDGTVPPLNPIDDTLVSADYMTFAYNVDLFLEHGSKAEGTNPTLTMPAWGDQKKLRPAQIADVIAYVIRLNQGPAGRSGYVPAASGVDIARPSNAGGAGQAITLTGNAASGQAVFAANCVVCHAAEGKGGVLNAGSTDGTVPPLNPIDETLVSADYAAFAYNLDLFLEHGSTPEGTGPILKMPAWGDEGKLPPQQIADVIAYLVTLNHGAVPAGPTPTPVEVGATGEVARPSNPGGAGAGILLPGDADVGSSIFAANCVVCHAAEGKGGVLNPGSTDGTVPPLNPIDDTLVSPDYVTFAYKLDTFIEHGSKPVGTSPKLLMPALGDQKKLQPAQISDVIAYVIRLNQGPAGRSGYVPAASGVEIARPSNTGGAGQAITLTGSAESGKAIFAANCVVCHAAEGKGGVPNPGSTDGTVPPLNPIDETLVSADPLAYAYNLDLFLEHGSTPEGASPILKMPAWGDEGKLPPQQIADVIAYLMSLNK